MFAACPHLANRSFTSLDSKPKRARYLRKRSASFAIFLNDLQPYATTQAVEREDILNIGGLSDQVFDVISEFAAGRLNGDH